MNEYRVERYEGAEGDLQHLETWLNERASDGWRIASTPLFTRYSAMGTPCLHAIYIFERTVVNQTVEERGMPSHYRVFRDR